MGLRAETGAQGSRVHPESAGEKKGGLRFEDVKLALREVGLPALSVKDGGLDEFARAIWSAIGQPIGQLDTRRRGDAGRRSS